MLSEVNENPIKFHGNQYTRSDAEVAVEQKQKDDVLTKTAKETGVSERTVASARKYLIFIFKLENLDNFMCKTSWNIVLPL